VHFLGGRAVNQVRMDAHPHGQAAETDVAMQVHQDSPGWWPLACLRSLGRAASIATGAQQLLPCKQHADYRGFRILTTEQDGGYCARVTHWRGNALGMSPRLRHDVDNARFGSHEEAAQHARFVIASGALNHLAPGAAADTARA